MPNWMQFPYSNIAKYEPVSAGTSLSWLGPFNSAIDSTVSRWLSSTMHVFSTNARAFCHKKDGIYFSVMKFSSNFAALRVIQFGKGGGGTLLGDLTTWAFGSTIDIPQGGYRAAPGKAFLIIKASGEMRWRTKTWIKRGGERIQVKGFIPQAIEATFTSQRLDELGRPLAHIISMGVALHLKQLYSSQGFNVQVL